MARRAVEHTCIILRQMRVVAVVRPSFSVGFFAGSYFSGLFQVHFFRVIFSVIAVAVIITTIIVVIINIIAVIAIGVVIVAIALEFGSKDGSLSIGRVLTPLWLCLGLCGCRRTIAVH
ncbi:hypothetical protein LX36DRAFT_388121 [Colletotrichum falcatum]|nr:hypothetical protein LX36DRAFT_388121 [Colletotrichum falcatum]